MASPKTGHNVGVYIHLSGDLVQSNMTVTAAEMVNQSSALVQHIAIGMVYYMAAKHG